jgi:hypothetical protein
MKSEWDITKVILLVLNAQSTDRKRNVIFLRFLHHSNPTDCRFTVNIFTITLYENWIADVGGIFMNL